MGKITINELSNSLKDYIKDKQDIVDNSLETNNKTIVGAINELVQNSVQNSNKIEEIKNRLYNLMIDNSYNVDSDTTYNELIDILKNEDINPCKIKQISGGGAHTMILMKSGELWACGYNNKGQLGLGDTTNINYFKQVTSDVKFVSCGYDFTYIIKNDGTLWSCGDGTDYKTGHGMFSEQLTEFTQVTANGISNDVKYVACSKGTTTIGHAMIIKNDNSLWSVGNGEDGQVGTGEYTIAHNGFKQVATDVEQVCCGKNFSIIKKLDKSVWFTGNDAYCFAGSSTNTYSRFTEMLGTQDEDILDIMCGSQHFFYREKAETGRIDVWSKGENGDGQLGIGSTTDSKSFNQITQTPMSIVSCGWSNSFLVTKTGNIWVAGLNGNGQLGLNSTTDKTSFTKIDLPGKTIY